MSTKRKSQSLAHKKVVKKKRRLSSYQAMVIQTGAAASSRQIEHKAVTLNSLQTIPANDPTWSTVTLINGITQGVASTARIGRKCVITAVQIRWLYEVAASATTESWVNWRLCIVYDSAPEGVLPTPSLIFDDNSALGNMNLNRSERFIVLHDEIIPGKEYGYMPLSIANGSSGYAGKFYKKFNPPLQMHFNATLGTIADIDKGAIYLMFCNFHNVAGAATTLYFNARTRFTDA